MDDYIIKPNQFNNNMNILIYGDPGVGKTYLAGTAQDNPYMADVHVFNVDGGMLTLAEREDIHATDIRSVDALEAEMHKIINGDPKYKQVKTVVIDNITELQTLTLEHIVSNAITVSHRKDKQGRVASVDDIYIEDYGKAGKQLARVLRGYRDLPMHVIYIAHRKDRMRKGTQTLEESKPALIESLATSVMGYMDFVWYLYMADTVETSKDGQEIINTNRYLLTHPYNLFRAKTRGTKFAEALGGVIIDPNLNDIMNIYIQCSERKGETK